MFGVPAVSIPFQLLRTPVLDGAAVMVHASHFAFFLLFGLVLWHARREHFQIFGRALILVMLLGLLGYALIPTAPPWMAAEPNLRVIPPVTHITRGIYTRYAEELYGSVDTNPVAAMPSLHVAFPFLCALIGWRAYGRRIAAAVSVYALIVMFVVVYLGEHYAVDVIAGVLVAMLAAEVARRMPRPLALAACHGAGERRLCRADGGDRVVVERGAATPAARSAAGLRRSLATAACRA